jgi:hypothetical protein
MIILDLQHLEVGQLFEPGTTHYQEEIKFEFTQGGPILLIFFDHLKQKEIDAVRSGKLKFGFYEYGNVIFTLAKFEGIPWMDAPYNVHLSPPFEFAEELDTDERLGFGLQIYLVDANTGILQAIRLVGLDHNFSFKFREAILKQKAAPFNSDTYNFKINDAYNRYKPDDLASFVRWFHTTRD